MGGPRRQEGVPPGHAGRLRAAGVHRVTRQVRALYRKCPGGASIRLDAGEAQLILDDLNAEPDPDADKEDWQKELEAKVVEETGALPDADDVDMTDKFAPPSGKEDEMMLTCECEECGYTLFIAAGREGKFFGDSYKCPEC